MEIQLTISINFVSSKDTEEERAMQSTSDSVKFASSNDANKVVNESLRSQGQDKLETSMKRSDFFLTQYN